MTNSLLKNKALQLRQLGKSYSQIKNELGISKSTLSGWLRKYPLSKEQIRLLRDMSEVRIEKFRETMRQKRQVKLDTYYDEARKNFLPLSKRDLLIAGIFLYWGEGGKTERGLVTISNTDPSVLQFALLWMRKALDIPKEKIQVLVHLYEDMDIQHSLDYWSNTLQISRKQFTKPYIKHSNRADLDEKGYGYGTCNLRVSNTIIKEDILMTIKAMGDYAAEYIENL